MSHRPFTFGPKKRRTERSAAYARPAPKRREAQRLPTPTDRLPRRYGLPVYLGCLLYLSTDSGQNSHPQSLDAVDATSHNTGQRQPRPTIDAVDATMIDFDIYEDSDANKPRPRRRRSSSKKRVSFGHREFLDAKENLVNVEQITPLKQSTPPVRRASRAVLAHIGGAKAKLFSAVTPAARRRRRQEKRDAAAAQKARRRSDAVTSTPLTNCCSVPPPSPPPAPRVDVPRPSPPPAAPVPDSSEATPSEKLAALAAHERLRRAKAGLDALTGRRRRPDESTRIDAVAELLMACSCAPPDAAAADPTDACEELEIEQPESPGPPTARRVFTPSPPRCRVSGE